MMDLSISIAGFIIDEKDKLYNSEIYPLSSLPALARLRTALSPPIVSRCILSYNYET